MRWLILIVMGFCLALIAGEIPKEEGLIVSSLKNGVQIWLKPTLTSEQEISCRLVAKHPGQPSPYILMTNCQLGEFEDELSCLIEDFKTPGCEEEECRLGVIVVGSFDVSEMEQFLTPIFEEFKQRRFPLQEESVTIRPTDNGGSFALSYWSCIKELRSDQDLKKLWVLSLIQRMTQEKLRKVMNGEGAQGLSFEENQSLLLPATHCLVKSKFPSTQDVALLLSKCLTAVQEIKRSGFSERELSDAKAPLQKKFALVYRSHPDQALLADYLAAHFALGAGCPDYAIFTTMSDKVIRDIGLEDIHTVLKESFKDVERKVEILTPKGVGVSEMSLLKILDELKANEIVLVPVAERVNDLLMQAQQAFAQLPLTIEEAKRIKELVENLAYKNEASLLWNRKEMLRLGESIQHVHPLKFLEVVLTNPELKKGLKEKVYGHHFKWRGFFDGDSGQRGFAQKMEHESNRNHLMPYLLGFSHAVKIHPDEILVFFERKDWEKLVIYLLLK